MPWQNRKTVYLFRYGLVAALVIAASACRGARAAEPAKLLVWPKQIKGKVHDDKGQPIEGVAMRLDVVAVDEYAFLRNERPLFSSSVQSAADGAYTFDLARCPPPQTRPFVVRLSGTAAGYAETKTWRWYSARRQAFVSDRFPMPQMDPARVVRGRCIDPAGKPVAGAVIKATASFEPGAMRRPRFWALDPRLSDARGEFELALPKAAAAQAWVISRDWVAELVEIPRDAARVDIALESGTRITGVAKSEAGKPLAGAVVVLENTFWGNDDQFGYALPLYQGVRTDRDGAFRLPPAKGDYKVYLAHAAPAAYDLASQDGHLRDAFVVADEAPPVVLPRFYSFGGGGQVQLTLEAGPTLILSGRIRWPDGRPAPGVEVHVLYRPEELQLKSPFTLGASTTDGQGSYSIEIPRPVHDIGLWIGMPHRDAKQVAHRAVPDADVAANSKVEGEMQFKGPLESDLNDLNWTLRPER
jgi:hypothetical protein